MALPTKERTWNTIVFNQPATGSRAENGGRVLYALKQAFLTAGWTVVRSCDRTSVSASDLWTDYTKVLWDTLGGTWHSWIVLQAPASLHTSLQLLISPFCNDNWGSEDVIVHMTAKFSFNPAGFSGGSTTEDPTASGTVTLRNGQNSNPASAWQNNVNDGAANHAFNFAYSTDGEALRCWICVNGAVASVILIEHAEDLLGGSYWGTEPVIVAWAYQPTYASFNDAAAIYANLDGTPVAVCAATLGWSTAMYGENYTFADEVGDGGWALNDVYLISTTVGSRGKIGRIKDLFFISSSPPNGATMPNDVGETRQFVKFGAFVAAWDGTELVQGTAPDMA